jgi:hypothetical protein
MHAADGDMRHACTSHQRPKCTHATSCMRPPSPPATRPQADAIAKGIASHVQSTTKSTLSAAWGAASKVQGDCQQLAAQHGIKLGSGGHGGGGCGAPGAR